MRQIAKQLLLVGVSDEARALINALPEGRYAAEHFAWSDLQAALSRAQLSSILLAEPLNPETAGETYERIEALRGILSASAAIPVVAISRHPESSGELLASLLTAGLTEWIDLSREGSPGGVERRLRYVSGVLVQRLLNRALPGPIPSRAQALLSVAAEVAAAGGDATELAAHLGVADRTLSRMCSRADLPPPRRLLAWLRVLLAAEYLDAGAWTLEAIARATGYSSGASIKTALRNMMRATPQQLRAQGAFSSVARAFAADLRSIREAGHARGRPAKLWLN